MSILSLDKNKLVILLVSVHSDTQQLHNIIGIKHDFPFINIRYVPRGVLKTEGVAQGFQHSPRDLANVNE